MSDQNGALRKNDLVELSEVDHVLRRPGIYIGSVKEELVEKWMFEGDKMVKQTIPFIPGLLKLVDEVIDNSIDEAVRTSYKFANQIEVKYVDGIITVRDNGRGLPIEKDADGLWCTEKIFTRLRNGSNFDDEQRAQIEAKGMNGVGVSLVCIFSEYLSVHTSNGLHSYRQRFNYGPVNKTEAKVAESKMHFTEVEFKPNYNYFSPSDDFKEVFGKLIYRSLRNAAFCFPEITFKFNGKRLPGARLKEFMSGIHEINEYNENDKVRLGIFCSDDGFQHLSFVNGLETVRGGTHVDYVADTLVHHMREHIKKKFKLEVKPADIKNKLFIMLSLRLGAPDFDGQTKERLITPVSQWNERFAGIFSEKFIRQIISNSEIIDPIVEAYRLKKQVEENLELKKLSGKKQAKVRVEKYLPATKERKYLVLTEGDAAKGGLVASLGRDQFSYFPLRGKPLNALEAKASEIKNNTENTHIVSILGLRMDQDIQDDLRYENILFATDADADGTHIKALLLSFFGRFTPSLIKAGRVKLLRTPIVTARKNGKMMRYFFDIKTYNAAKKAGELNGMQLTYYKGLGTFKPEVLAAIFAESPIESFMDTLVWDDNANEALKEWVGPDSEPRKKYLRGKTFQLDAV